ncbi:hypothetical protein [Mesorhizobium australicum]|uniref:Uncharacterized protein n=1 Tax=Mesorhizobium australicum TaxID=536018 RepID=A0A1X7NX13_9HYPH|nr:hypothetical protein [Mesorhizobium australicum]SMH42723.1 hypothetical protein SAMN02982922_2789 [Mesorhizobium australicum]
MGRGISEAQWFAARELSEGQPPTRVRVAAVLGVDNSHVYSRSSAEGWKTIDHRNQEIRGLYREVQAIAAALSGRAPPEEKVADLPPLDEKEARGPEGQPRPANPPADPAAIAPEPAMGPDAGEGAARGPAAEPALAVPDWDRMDPVELLANASGFVARQVGRLIENADRRGGRLDKAQVEGLAALGKMMDRWEVLAAERTKDDKKKSDEKLADVFKRIDRRIVELAVEGAEFLDQRRRRGRGTTRRRGMADAGSPGTDSDLAQPAR